MASPFTTYKLIILYMLQNSDGDLTNSQITDFILDRKYTNYFQLQQAVATRYVCGSSKAASASLISASMCQILLLHSLYVKAGLINTRMFMTK